MRILWLITGLFALALGLLGIVLPLLPTVPFLLLAAFCFSRSSTRLHDWLLDHPIYGSHIKDWRERGAIHLNAKRWATVMMIAAFALSIGLGIRTELLIVQGLVLICVGLFIWTRPHH